MDCLCGQAWWRTGTIKKSDKGNIALVTDEKKRYLIIKKLHEKVKGHIDKKVTITGGVKAGKKEGTQMMVYIGKVETPKAGAGKGKAKGKGKGKGKGKAE